MKKIKENGKRNDATNLNLSSQQVLNSYLWIDVFLLLKT